MSKPFLRPRSGHSLFKSGSICIFVPELYDARILKGCQQSHPAQLFQPILVNFHFGSSSMATARGRGGGFGRRWSGRHARAAAETAGCRLGRRRSHRRPRTSAAPSTSSPLIGRQFEVSSLSVGLSAVSVGLLVESGRAIDLPSWSVSCRVVCACWGSVFPGSRNQDFFVSALVCVRRSVCGCVSVRLLAQFLRRGTPLFFPSVLSFVLVCAHAVMGSAGVVLSSVSASASAGSSGGCCWWERSRAHARVLSSVF